MFPVLFSIGPFTLHTYGIFVATGIVAGVLVTIRIGRSRGIMPQNILDMSFIIIFSGIIGSRLLYILMNLSYYGSNPLDMPKLWQGGLVFSGGLLAGLIALIWHARQKDYNLLLLGDIWSPGVAIGQGIGRIGCFMAGCCYGKPTTVAWGVIFTDPRSLARLNIPLHPTQVYSSLSGFVIFIILMILTAKKKFEGQVLLWFLILHSASRLLVERFRGDDRGLIPGTDWSVTQFSTVFILIGAVIMLLIMKTRQEKKP
jgi:phosphatidylglycerol:prolipoprotein diacylglycerol transferase